MTMLHIIRSSGFNSNALTQCLGLVANNDSIILMDDGCYNLQHPLLLELLESNSTQAYINVYFIDSHAHARAQSYNNMCKAITLTNMLDLIFKHNNSITWS